MRLAAPDYSICAGRSDGVILTTSRSPALNFIAPFAHRILNTLKHIGWLRGQNLYIFHSPSGGHVQTSPLRGLQCAWRMRRILRLVAAQARVSGHATAGLLVADAGAAGWPRRGAIFKR